MPTPEPTAKELLQRIVDAQPDDISFDDLLRELYVYRMVRQGLEDIEAGRTLTHEQVEAEARTWFK